VSEPPIPRATFCVRYHRHDEVRADAQQQLTRGGLLVKITDHEELTLDDPVELVLVMPDGAELHADGRVLQVLPGFGVAISTPPALVDAIRKTTAWQIEDRPDAGAAEHTRVRAVPTREELPVPPPLAAEPSSDMRVPPHPARSGEPIRLDELTHAQKIHMALHGNRDERNAILRDRNRALHPFVLKNPQITLDDVTAMAKNAQLAPDVLKLIAERKEWMQRPQVALALAKNPRTPPDLAIRALEHVPVDALRAIAKGAGALPHVVQAARKKVVG
jgi:hypothetical protein